MLLFKFCIGDQKVSLTEELKIIAAVQVYHFTFIDNVNSEQKKYFYKIFNRYLIGTLVGLFCQLVLKHEHI